MAIRAIVFDLFDTLVDLHMENLPRIEFRGRSIPSTAGLLHAAAARHVDVDFETFAEALVEVDRGFRETRYKLHRELPTEERFTALCQRLGLPEDELPLLLTEVHMARLREQVAVPPHHAEVLGRLRGRVPLGLCSNFSHSETAERVLALHGLREPLSAVAISDEVGLRKPRGEIFDAVLRALGVEPREALHVGDSLDADVSGAAAHGMRTAWITRRVGDPEARLREHAGPRPDWQIGDLAELLEFV